MFPSEQTVIVAVGERQFEGVISDEPELPDTDVFRHRVDIQNANPGIFIDAGRTATIAAQCMRANADRSAIGPIEFKNSLGLFEPNARGSHVNRSDICTVTPDPQLLTHSPPINLFTSIKKVQFFDLFTCRFGNKGTCDARDLR